MKYLPLRLIICFGWGGCEEAVPVSHVSEWVNTHNSIMLELDHLNGKQPALMLLVSPVACQNVWCWKYFTKTRQTQPTNNNRYRLHAMMRWELARGSRCDHLGVRFTAVWTSWFLSLISIYRVEKWNSTISLKREVWHRSYLHTELVSHMSDKGQCCHHKFRGPGE